MGPAKKSLLKDRSLPKKENPVNKKIEANSPFPSLGTLQRTLGNNAYGGFIQTKLKVNKPGDKYEKEADRVADEVVNSTTPNIQQQMMEEETLQRKCSACKKEEELQMKAEAGQDTDIASPEVSQKIQNAGGGNRLSSSVNSEMSLKMGADFSNVNIHTGSEAAQMNQSLGARAFTHGRDIFFNEGEYNPESKKGKLLLAHELTHVVQQGSGGVKAIQHYNDGEGGMIQKQSTEFIEQLKQRGRGILDRGRKFAKSGAQKWGEGKKQARTLAEELMTEGVKKGRELEAEGGRIWSEGNGEISNITFDGAKVKLIGATNYEASAVSGLMSNANPDNRKQEAGLEPDTDCTKPKYQDLPYIGPIPEGEYYLEPSEVQTSANGSFDPQLWGGYRTRLHEKIFTIVKREVGTDRGGGFFLHEDRNANGTAGCIGVRKSYDNKKIHSLIGVNSARIPVSVSYPDSSASLKDAKQPFSGEVVVQRQAVHRQRSLNGIYYTTQKPLIQLQPNDGANMSAVKNPKRAFQLDTWGRLWQRGGGVTFLGGMRVGVVYFPTGASGLDADDIEALSDLRRQLARELAKHDGNYTLEFRGWADKRGTQSDNLILSNDRAKTVARFFSSFTDYSNHELEILPMGEYMGRKQDVSAADLAAYRRVDIIIRPPITRSAKDENPPEKSSITCECSPMEPYKTNALKYIRSIAPLIKNATSSSPAPAMVVAAVVADEYGAQERYGGILDKVQNKIIDALPEGAIEIDQYFDFKKKLLNVLENDIGPANFKVRTALEIAMEQQFGTTSSDLDDLDVSYIIDQLLTDEGTVQATVKMIEMAHSRFSSHVKPYPKPLVEAVYVSYFKQGNSYYEKFMKKFVLDPSHRPCPGTAGCRYIAHRQQIKKALDL